MNYFQELSDMARQLNIGRFSNNENTQSNELEVKLTPVSEKPASKKMGRPKKETGKVSDTCEKICLMIDREKMKKLRQLAFISRKSLKDVAEECFEFAIKTYEKKNGPLDTDNNPSSLF